MIQRSESQHKDLKSRKINVAAVVVVVVAAAAAIVVVVRLTRYDVKQTYTKPEELNFKFIQKSSYYAEHSLYIFRVTFVTIHRHVM